MIEVAEYELRRNKLYDLLKPNSIAILFAGVSRKSTNDECFDFEPNRSFYYLTGIKQENSVVLLAKTETGNHTYLFIDEKNPNIEKWYGIKMSCEEANKISGIENILFTNALNAKLEMILGNGMTHFGLISNLYVDKEEDLLIGNGLNTVSFAESLNRTYSSLNVLDVHPHMCNLRMIKSKAEIEMIKDAINTTELGLNKVLKEIKDGNAKTEYNLRNAFECTIKDDGNSTLAFHSIVAAGKNGVILHYPSAEGTLGKKDLVLLDVGAAKDYYNADISRTYPVSGKFTEIQKKIYSIVLECQKVCIGFLRPGITLKEYKDFARDFLAEECFAKGLIESKDKIGDVYYHGVGHHLGLDTHDQCDMNAPLAPGMVLTCEPGLYFKDYEIGIRIEDDILITEDGSECLSQNIIKSIEELESLLA
ncbi:MAG: Xaa-Pro peptidase family protein [Bacilli bacterium]|nr:Xaa-Pro peptidase family protein [Bacilli bacterium]